MRIRLSVPDELDDQERRDALNAALESVTIANTGLIRRGLVPTAAEAIRGGVRWQPEPKGDEYFDIATTVIGRGHGDCDDLAPWHAASLRASGRDPGAQAVVKRSGPNRWHALVLRSDQSIEDPSRAAGMGHSVSGEDVGAGPAIQRPMTDEPRLCVAICPTRDPRHPKVFYVRCDAPDRSEPWAWSSIAAHPHPGQAIVHSLKALKDVAGDELDEDDEMRLGVLYDLVCGADPYEIAEALSGELDQDEVLGVVLDGMHSVGFLGDILKKASSAFGGTPLGTMASFIPGMPAAPPVQSSMPGRPGAGMPGSQSMPIMQMKEILRQYPQLAPLAQMALPMAGMAFGGPFGAAGGSMLSQFVAPQQQSGAPQGFGGMIPGGMIPGFGTQASFGIEPNVMAQMFGGAGPSFLRF
jgi:hypothetical protein